MSAIAAIHVARKQLGLDDDTARDLYARVTGKRSLRDMTPAEQDSVVGELRRQGFRAALKGGSKTARTPLKGPFAKKLQALWISAWNLGLVENPDDAALLAFVKRQTGIDHVRFLHHWEDAAKAIEALKAWMSRGTGVAWPAKSEDTHAVHVAIVRAQLRLLGREPWDFSRAGNLIPLMRELGTKVQEGEADRRRRAMTASDLENAGRAVAVRVIDHLDTMYPAALKAVPGSARVSLRNTVEGLVHQAIAEDRERREAELAARVRQSFPLTQKQQQALDFLTSYAAEHGAAPSFGEIAAALGLKSKSGVHRLLLALEDRGRIRRLAARARAIRVLEPRP